MSNGLFRAAHSASDKAGSMNDSPSSLNMLLSRHIGRRKLIGLLGSAVVGWSHVARAQQKTMPVIGFLSNNQVPDAQSGVRALVRRLEELGWTEGGNVRIDYRSDDGDADRRRNNAAELVREGLDAITTFGTPELMAAARETRTIPIVFMSVSDPVGLRLCRESRSSRRQHHGVRQLRACDWRQVVGAARKRLRGGSRGSPFFSTRRRRRLTSRSCNRSKPPPRRLRCM